MIQAPSLGADPIQNFINFTHFWNKLDCFTITNIVHRPKLSSLQKELVNYFQKIFACLEHSSLQKVLVNLLKDLLRLLI